jgi:AsmA-like protein
LKRLFSRRVVIVVVVLLIGLWLLRPGARPLRGRVSRSISQALGRNVQIGAVHLQFLPRPGFELDDLVVFDDPRFGAEPLLRAPNVTASLRIRSLLRGRLEISALSLTDASVNLTRDAQGKWNAEDLIDRTSHSSLAPTAATSGGSSPSFPYIEASRARINFKLGTEKTHFALNDAEFAFWQESANTWGGRLQARPIRTDSNLTDTGVINVSGLWRRSASVHQTPLQVSFAWKQAQLGQLSRLIYGTDKDWRGGVILTGSLVGTPEHLRSTADISVSDFRRQDIMGGGTLNLTTHCTGEYDAPNRAVSNLDCESSSGNGLLQVKGGVSGILANGRLLSTSNLWFIATRVPAEGIVLFARHAGTSLPADLKANGDANLSLQIMRAGPNQPMTYSADGSLEDITIGNDAVAEITIGTAPVSLISDRDESHRPIHHKEHSPVTADENLGLVIGPVTLASGKHGTLIAQAGLTRSGYRASIQGEGGLKRLLDLAKALSIPSPTVAADGAANVKLSISGAWGSGERPLVEGSAQLRDVRAQISGLNAPIEITAADLAIAPDSVKVQNLSARGADGVWRGSMQIPRPCSTPETCELQFKLHTASLDTAALNKLLNPAQRKGPWYRFLSLGASKPPYLLQARASGTISIDKLKVGAAMCTHFSGDLRTNRGNISLSEVKGEFLGGTVTGNWTADYSVKPPRYSGSGTFEDVSLSPLGEWMHNSWIDGSGSAKYEFKASGTSLPELLDAAEINSEFSLSDSRFPHIVLVRESSPLRAETFAGNLQLQDGVFSFQKTKLATADEVYTVSGTASLAGALNLKAMSENANGFSVTGTLLKTRVSPISATEASLKP